MVRKQAGSPISSSRSAITDRSKLSQVLIVHPNGSLAPNNSRPAEHDVMFNLFSPLRFFYSTSLALLYFALLCFAFQRAPVCLSSLQTFVCVQSFYDCSASLTIYYHLIATLLLYLFNTNQTC